MSTDPMENPEDLLKDIFAKRKARIDEHEKLRASEPFQQALKRVDKLVWEYGEAINAIDFQSTRWPPFYEEFISLRMKQQFAECVISAGQLIKEGFHTPARRELRFLVEASVKALWLDTGSPEISDSRREKPISKLSDVKAKVGALDDLGRERFAGIVKSLKFKMIDDAGAEIFRSAALDLYSKLSTHVHVSSQNIGKDLQRFEKGQDIGFETVKDVNSMADLMQRVLDLALASHFEAFMPSLVGDIFVEIFDENKRWTFHKTPLVAAVSRHFDYKAERQSRG
ncbi:hypothetical protein [Microvirga lenta]|uniref:hypothetical protein n=1 Tax=Microvirga lenta TaxID=2881337 RepID=UPI001CFF5896|nr:hypothetical protein [Microvirga lenta]MCB5175539.1 hypothetical protein [Microvirga lenta]